MTSSSFTTIFEVAATPAEVFDTINDVAAWWSGEITGPTRALGDQFTYRYKDMHFSRQQITEFRPGRRVAWLVVESRLSFVPQQNEWDGTRITFDIAPRNKGSRVTFTHEGLEPAKPCYDDCSGAWTFLVAGLRKLIDERKAAATVAA